MSRTGYEGWAEAQRRVVEAAPPLTREQQRGLTRVAIKYARLRQAQQPKAA